jgi:CRISPR-associated protein Cmr4
MKTRAFLLHALSPLHAGTGQAVDVIDLPIARQRATGIPILPGSTIKGVLRDARRTSLPEGELLAVFGPETADASAHSGAVVVGDARLLLLPVRSFRGTFAYVTSPLLLELMRRDCDGALTLPSPVPPLAQRQAYVAAGSLNLQGADKTARIFLEDLDLPATINPAAEAWGGFLAQRLLPADARDALAKRFVIVDDETATFLWETATQVDTRVRLSEETRTVAKGALWVEESLPPETVLAGLLVADRSRRKEVVLGPDDVLARTLGREEVLQFGGKASVGRGRCRMVPLQDAR